MGDILFFLPGKYEINCAEKLLRNLLENTDCEEYSIHRLYSDQDPMKIDEAIQKKRAGQGRRIILSTNVAETSLTIEDVKYVIDCGFQRRNLFLPKNDGTTVLETVVISRASADQRKGRAGRTQAGKCYRLYSEQIFSQKFTPSTPEDMIREDVSSVVLHLFAMGYSEPWNFDFITPPTPCQLGFSFKRLIEFGAIEENGEGMFKITEFGEQIVRLPLDVEDAVCMIRASECNVQLPIAKIIAIKQFQERLFVIDGQVKQWVHPQGDHLSLLNIMEAYLHVKDKHNFRFSLKNLHLREDTLKKAYRIYIQLANKFSGYENMNSRHKDYYPTILKCLLFGKRHNVAYFKRKHTYVKFPSLRMVLTLDRKLFMKHMHYNPLFIFYDKARFSEYQIKAQITSLCRPEWIKEIWEQDGSWNKLQRDRKRIFNSIEEQLIITEY